MTRILTIIALLFATPAWAGEVDGNSFYCSAANEFLGPVAIHFQNNGAYQYEGAGVQQEWSYENNDDYVIFNKLGPDFFIRMNRKTLAYEYVGIKFGEIVGQRVCEFMEITQAKKLVNQYLEPKWKGDGYNQF